MKRGRETKARKENEEILGEKRKGKQGVSCQPPVIPDRVKHWLHV